MHAKIRNYASYVSSTALFLSNLVLPTQNQLLGVVHFLQIYSKIYENIQGKHEGVSIVKMAGRKRGNLLTAFNLVPLVEQVLQDREVGGTLMNSSRFACVYDLSLV